MGLDSLWLSFFLKNKLGTYFWGKDDIKIHSRRRWSGNIDLAKRLRPKYPFEQLIAQRLRRWKCWSVKYRFLASLRYVRWSAFLVRCRKLMRPIRRMYIRIFSKDPYPFLYDESISVSIRRLYIRSYIDRAVPQHNIGWKSSCAIGMGPGAFL